MPRKRTLTPEWQAQDRNIASGIVTALYALAERYPSAGLNAAAGIVDAFVDSSPDYPDAFRLRRPAAHASPAAVEAWEHAVAQAVKVAEEIHNREIDRIVLRTEADAEADAERRILEHDNPPETDP